jgi:hypothetical protein
MGRWLILYRVTVLKAVEYGVASLAHEFVADREYSRLSAAFDCTKIASRLTTASWDLDGGANAF